MQTVERTIGDAMIEVARELAIKHKLIRADGSIACWKCGSVNALMPSLHCARCLQAHRDWMAGGAAHTVNVAQQTVPPAKDVPKDWHDTEKDPAEDWDRGEQ